MNLRTSYQAHAGGFQLFLPPLEVDYNPQAWSHANISDTTGSWPYALNLPQGGEAKPGFLSFRPSMDGTDYYGTMYPQTPEELQKRLYNDEISYLGDVLPEKGHVIAFFAREPGRNPNQLIMPRRDSNGCWSMKPDCGCGSPNFPQQKDFTGKLMTDIREANFGLFTNFLGFASIPYDGILYHPRHTIDKALMKPFLGIVPALEELGLNKGP